MTEVDDPRRTRIDWRWLGGIAAAVVVTLLVFSTRYGYHRDELYFIAAGRHPAWGYPDQPPLTPILAMLMNVVGGGSLFVLRIPAALAAGAVTLLAGLCAREFGGGRFAQVLAAVTMALSSYVLISGHLLVTSTVDLLIWVTLTWLALRLLRGADQRLWVVVGVVAGLGFLNKQLPIVLLIGLLFGMLLTPAARPLLLSKWPWIGAAIAALMWAPVLIWQAQHGWPQFELAEQIREEYGTPAERTAFVALQFVIFSLGATYLWIRGLLGLFRNPAWQRFRVFAWAWVFVLAFFIVTAGQVYYATGMYPVLVAAGAAVVEHGRRRWAPVVLVAASSALMLPASLPLLPPTTFADTFYADVADSLMDTIGWPALIDQVSVAYESIPAEQRATAVVFTSNYGEAGAVDRLGRAEGLPGAWSGHNGYGLWGPPPQDAVPVVLVWQGGTPSRFFSGCREVGDVDTGVDNEEGEEAVVYVCDGPIGGWAAAWPQLTFLAS